MNIKRTLMGSYIAIILLVMIVFAMFAYQIAKQAFVQKEMEIAEVLSSEKSLLLAKAYQEHPSLYNLSRYINELEHGSDVFLIMDESNHVVFPYNSSEQLHIEDLENHLHNKTALGIHHEEIKGVPYVWAGTRIDGTPYSIVYLCTDIADEVTKPITSLTSRMIASGIVMLWIAAWISLIYSSAISQKLETQQKTLERQASTDHLTQLSNRALLQNVTEELIKKVKKEEKLLSLIMLDLDNFKVINDTLGHHIGDELLIQVSNRLRNTFKDASIIARLGGDEFGLVFIVNNKYQAMQAVDRIMTCIDRPFQIEGMSLDTKASIGVALAPQHGDSALTLIRRADVAMYIAKDSGGGFNIYDPDKDPHSLNHLTLMTDLRHVIEKDQLQLYYQPKIDLSTQKIVGVEALCRWKHPEQGMISPDVFIGMAEQIGMIKPITLWVLYVGIHQCKEWHRAGLELSIAINLSTQLLQDSQLPARISDALRNENLSPKYLTLEITETAVMHDPVRAMEILKQLSTMGIKLSLDDFGTGYTSLAYLKHMPVDELKIDKSFIMDMLDDSDDATIVVSMIQLAHSMQHQVVAEGVENDEILGALQTLGCDLAQGFYMARPMPANELEKWLKESQWGMQKEDDSETGMVISIPS